jgi:hypothetical protein
MEIPVFAGDWQENRKRLPRLLRWVSGSAPILEVREVGIDGSEGESLKPESFARRIQHFRKIELEQQRAIDLAEGFIQGPEDFRPHDEEWAEPDAPPNGGPATQLGNSGVTEGPPSVS